MNVLDSLDYPLRGDDGIRSVLIGSGLILAGVVLSTLGSLLSFLILPLLLIPLSFVPFLAVGGYHVRVLDSTLDGAAAPPTFDDWESLIVDGLKLVAVSLVYSLPFVVLVFGGTILTVTVFAAGANNPELLAGGSIVLVGVVSLLGFLLAIAIGYVVPCGLCAMVEEDDLKSAFDVGRIRSVATNRDYAVAWAVGAVVYIGGVFLGQVLNLFVITALIGIPLVFVAVTIAFRMVAIGYADARGIETTTGNV